MLLGPSSAGRSGGGGDVAALVLGYLDVTELLDMRWLEQLDPNLRQPEPI